MPIAAQEAGFKVSWVSPRAPYMPVAAVGLLDVLAAADPHVALGWQPSEDPPGPPQLTLSTALPLEDVADTIATSPWPQLDVLDWRATPGQAIKPTLKKLADSDTEALSYWRRLAGFATPPTIDTSTDSVRVATQRLVAALLTDGVLDSDGLPGRNRLLRGVKADLSGVTKPPKMTPDEIAEELANGPVWAPGSSGLGLGLVPEVHTFGGTTGPTPSNVGAFSKLLYRLCWHGIMAMPPFGAKHGARTIIGGPLFSDATTMSWPVWSMPLRRTALVALFGLAAVHAVDPDPELLRAHGIQAVFRSRAREINTMISVFGWGDRVA